jgi:hypothetical protein
MLSVSSVELARVSQVPRSAISARWRTANLASSIRTIALDVRKALDMIQICRGAISASRAMVAMGPQNARIAR